MRTRGHILYRLHVKRWIDILFSALGIIILIPIWFLIMMLIKLESKGPVLFKQKRIGIHKSVFMILKFRTMRINAPQNVPTHKLTDPEHWITRTGRILRKTSLDELPQLYNILVGDMSIIGPRPALWNQDDLISERDQYGANDVLPGLTGWAQINGRDELEIAEKAKLDGEYVQRMSFLFDMKCFLGSVVSIVKRDGIAEGGTGKLNPGKGKAD